MLGGNHLEEPIQQIIKDVLQGEKDKYALIVTRCEKFIFNYCYHMLGDYGDAEDCSQEVFLKAYRGLHTYQPDRPFEAWLYRIAYNHSIDMLRKRKVTRLLPFLYKNDRENNHVDQAIDHKYYNPAVLHALAALSAEERSLLILRCVEDKSYNDISLVLNQNTAYLRKKFQRAAAKFRKNYVSQEEEKPNDAQRSRTRAETTISKS
ncbi:RNA polymerase [Paenibacillus silvae]|uniref:RNA polymerase n=1 Tax=Paenibacillus silvae TaxID=1325358 RepID=A0A2W6PC19_9BACL|nr:RNA polymerase [Paenibacillus silvae]